MSATLSCSVAGAGAFCHSSNSKISRAPFFLHRHHHIHNKHSFLMRGFTYLSWNFHNLIIILHIIQLFMCFAVANDADRTDLSTEKSDADKIVDGMNFGELCNEFECISSPLVESTARQLARDILELREGNRALATLAVSVRYRDPVRSFIGRDKYKRPLWARGALNKPSVSVQEMVMLSTSVLSIKWTIRGKPKSLIGGIAGDLILRVTSRFTLNQISGQVIEHQEFWDLSASSAVAQAFFWTSRSLFATLESGKDLVDIAKNMSGPFSTKKENLETYPDPSADPTKFFQRDDSFERDAYQIALLLAVLYFVVQFLRTTL